MHIVFLIFVSTATFTPFAYASTPFSPDTFRERPVIKEVNMLPAYNDLFKSLRISATQSSPIGQVSLTGLSLSGGTPYAHLLFEESHLYAKIGETLPDGSELVSIDVNRGHITTRKNNLFTTHTLVKYD